MNRILSLVLIACLFLLPGLSLAEAQDTTLSLHVSDALATDETMTAAIDVVNAFGLRTHTQDGQFVLAFTLSDEDVLDFAFEADENQNLYVAGNLLGDKTLTISGETLNALMEQLHISATPAAPANLNLDNTMAALQSAMEMGQSTITEWDETSDKPDLAIVISVSSENAAKVLDALEADLSAADFSNVTLPADAGSVEEQIQKFIATVKESLPEGEFLSLELGVTMASEVVYFTFQASCNIANGDEKKAVTVTVDEARTTTEKVLWEGGVTVAVEGSDERAFVANSLETSGDNSELNLVLYSVDESDQMTPIGAFVRDAVHTSTESGFRFESSNAAFTYDAEKNPTEVGELHLLLTADGDVLNFNADAQQTSDGPALVSVALESKPGETEPSRITAELYPINDFTEETLQKVIQEVVSENLMTVAMNALSKLPPSAMNLVGGLMGE
ncbi:MAG: hypothetical protein K5746_07135 [Clostridiales bacterium]|nr:hypothetical protein [Clostridiales bacterium]